MAERNMEESEKAKSSHAFEETILSKHLERQLKICKNLNLNIDDLDIGSILEKHLFCPKEKNTDNNPHLNFYPPFLIPECLALHYPFFLSVQIPLSCKANRSGTKTYQEWMEINSLATPLPKLEKCKWDDSLGNVAAIEELESNQRLIKLEQDSLRLFWCKEKAKYFSTFSYPSLSLPPALQKILIEIFIGKSQEPNNLSDKYEPAITQSMLDLLGIQDNLHEVQERLFLATTYGTTLVCMKKLIEQKKFIMNCQESLHYTFNHGFVKLIQMLTDINLSEFVTFHGVTHRNRLNNPYQHSQLENQDKMDFLTDSIYLFLVLTWQTAMDIWGQTLDETTINQIKERLDSAATNILKAPTAFAVAEEIASIIFPDILLTAFTNNLPDFINQAQIGNFRNFICCKSGIPQSICPFLPSDFVPLSYMESHPILWTHVTLLRTAQFLLLQGNYLYTPDKPYTISTLYCECNLCSPHRMPCYNSNLLNEILTIGKFEFQKPVEGQPTLKLTPQCFANAYLSKVNAEDFFHDKIVHYNNNKDKFNHQLTACVLKDEKLLATLTEMQVRREKELLKRGSGVYLDPESGEQLNGKAFPNGENLSPYSQESKGKRNGDDVSLSKREQPRRRASQRRRSQ
ncbi:100K protein [Bovine atadenovirus D]|uniref:100K protein n=1 Tax=Bovine adenovirus 4 TaxID=70333 RepID=Q997H6_ADEB4|nr:100K protein [Bovine atadenovirus D]AAK13166.1 100K protein [Bovine adenovirus 4]